MHSLTSLLLLSFVGMQGQTAAQTLGPLDILPDSLVSLFTLPVLGTLTLALVSATIAVLIEIRAEKLP